MELVKHYPMIIHIHENNFGDDENAK